MHRCFFLNLLERTAQLYCFSKLDGSLPLRFLYWEKFCFTMLVACLQFLTTSQVLYLLNSHQVSFASICCGHPITGNKGKIMTKVDSKGPEKVLM